MNNGLDFSALENRIVPGISNVTLFLLAGLVIIAWMLTSRVEKFMGRTVVTDEEYIQDIRNMSSYVGPYIGEIYLYLRAKYYDPIKSIPGSMYKPGSITDPTLADPLLPIARTQIKAWIDTGKLRMKQKYGDTMITRLQPNWDLNYIQTTNGTIEVTHIENGKSATYIV
jgi:hypothetical protein